MFEFYIQKKGDFEYSKIILSLPVIRRITCSQNHVDWDIVEGFEASFETGLKFTCSMFEDTKAAYFRYWSLKVLGFGISWQWQNSY